ncbi:MAG: hypothetical protein NZL98_11575 [Anaerolineales bacterium]|nr:hypothetical protein [Anaerolineales bacterium]MDW8226992.1 hypothetical protein [Anaerolineales bacterium]
MKPYKIPGLLAAIVLTMLACSLIPSDISLPDASSEDATATPFQEPTATMTEESLPAGPCDNPLFPVRLGATWEYHIISDIPDTFTRRIVEVSATGFTEQDVFQSGVTRTGQWACSEGNLIMLIPSGGGFASSVSGDNIDAQFITSGFEGITLPVEIRTGDSWTFRLVYEGEIRIGEIRSPGKNEMTLNCQAGQVETITVPAGTFQARRITCETIMNVTITYLPDQPPMTLSFTSIDDSWMAEGVGLVKSVSTTEGMTATTELLSYSIP